jgi:hypothetical protein
VDLREGHLARVLLDVVQAAVVDLAELGALLLEVDVEERVLLGEVERVVGRVRLVGGLRGRVVVPQLRSVLVVVLVLLELVMIVVLLVPVAFLPH